MLKYSINTLDEFKKIINHEPYYGTPILPINQEDDFKELYEYFNNKTVAIIGPSSILENQNKGEEIDSYDIICKVGDMFNFKSKNYGSRIDVLFNGCFPNHNKIDNYTNINLKRLICPIKPCINGIKDVHNRDIYKHYNYLKNNLSSIKFNKIGLLSCYFDNEAKTRATLGTFAIYFLLQQNIKKLGIYGFDWYNNDYFKEYTHQYKGSHGFAYDLEKNLLKKNLLETKIDLYLNIEVKESLNI